MDLEHIARDSVSIASGGSRSRWVDSRLSFCGLHAPRQSFEGVTSQSGRPGAGMDAFGDRYSFQQTTAACKSCLHWANSPSGHRPPVRRATHSSSLASPSIRRGQEEGRFGVPFRFPPIHPSTLASAFSIFKMRRKMAIWPRQA